MEATMEEIRVLHVPCNVPYIQKLQKPGCLRIANTSNTPSFGWLCDQAKDAAWFNTFDVCHIHFGFEFEEIETVRSALGLLHKNEKPIIFTLHELSSVHGVAQEQYVQYLKMICDHSDALITLTEASRRKFTSLCGDRGTPSVIPHGMVSNAVGVSKKESEGKSVLIFGSLRKNRDALPSTINLTLSSVGQWGVRLVTKPFSEAQLQDSVLQTVIALHGGSSLSVETTLPMTDSEITQVVMDADVLVLPYLETGHSGQLELAFDCGTPVVCTNVGFLEDQVSFWPSEFRSSVSVVDWSDGKRWLYQERLVSAVKQLLNSKQPERLILDRRRFRANEHEEIIRAHRTIYERAMSQTLKG